MRKLLYLMLVMMVAACSSIDCPVDNVVETRYTIMDNEGDKLTLSDSITVWSTRANGKDTILLNRGIDIDHFALQISNSHPEDILFFSFDKTTVEGNDTTRFHRQDTVWVKKDDYPSFESVDCSAVFFHTLTGVRHTHNYIDSIVINNPSVTYDPYTVHFYFYPKTDF